MEETQNLALKSRIAIWLTVINCENKVVRRHLAPTIENIGMRFRKLGM